QCHAGLPFFGRASSTRDSERRVARAARSPLDGATPQPPNLRRRLAASSQPALAEPAEIRQRRPRRAQAGPPAESTRNTEWPVAGPQGKSREPFHTWTR